jgi:hypothetical protein
VVVVVVVGATVAATVTSGSADPLQAATTNPTTPHEMTPAIRRTALPSLTAQHYRTALCPTSGTTTLFHDHQRYRCVMAGQNRNHTTSSSWNSENRW